MKKLFFYILFLPLLIFSCASTPLPSGGQEVNIPEDFLGIVHAGQSLESKENEILDEMGCKWVLSTFYWHSIESQKDNFNYSHYDKIVNENKKQGRKIIALLGYGTDFSYPNGKNKKYISKEYLPFFLRYVEETVRHYKGQVDVWCIWNEPNLFSWRGTDGEFYKLSKLTTDVIRKTDPDAYIIGGAFCRTPVGFIKRMNKAGAMEGLDGLALHPYDFNPSGSMKLYDLFTKTLSEINYSGTVWITEIGFPTGGWYPTKVSDGMFPAYIVKTIAGTAARGARTLLWYQINDDEDIGVKSLDSEGFFGLLYKDFSRKAGSWAYELCARFLPGSRFFPELPRRENIPSKIVSFCFLDGISGNNTLILWNDRKDTQKIELNLPAAAMIHDISTGQSSPLPAEASLVVTDKPLFITWQGPETPCIIKKR
jgi:polysaccharide biosynthesis protein PslG